MKLLLQSASVAVLALAVSGCITAPPPALKLADLPKAFTAPIPEGAPAWPQPDWWKGFGSDEMTGIVADARADNLDLAEAASRVLEAQAEVDIARATLFPSIGVSGSVLHAGAKTGKPVNTFGASLSASYQQNLFGGNIDSVRQALESAKSAKFAEQSVELTITSDTADAYLNVLALRERLKIANDNIKAAKEVLGVTQAKVENGVSSRLDLAQQTAQLASQEAQIPRLEEQEREARYTLALLLARVPEGYDVTAKDLSGITPPAVAPGIPSDLLRRRPDIAEAEAQLAAAHANLDAAHAAFFPSIDLTGSAGYASTALSTLFHGSNLAWSLGGSLLETIFNGGERIGEMRLARAQQEELISSYRATVLQAFSDVETALGQVSSLAEQEKYTKEEVDNAAEAFRISEIQYREGVADLLAVLQSQQTLFTAEDTLVQIKLARIQAEVGLYNALGGGWTEDADDVTQPIPTPKPKPAE